MQTLWRSNHSSDINSFYKNFNETTFKGITVPKLMRLKLASKKLNYFFINENSKLTKRDRYVAVMNKITTGKNNYNIESEAQKYILFMYSIDPTFEAAKIYGECNNIKEVKTKMNEYFHMFDMRLIFIENFFIKYFLSQEKRNEINTEIEKRAFK